MKTSNFMLMLWIPSALAVHLCSLRQLVEPQEHYSYTMVLPVGTYYYYYYYTGSSYQNDGWYP
jgi:hypothetical protein